MFGLTVMLALLAADPASPAPKLMTPPEFQALPSKPADAKLTYGSDPNQFGELRVPAGTGTHPVVVLVHGGCFRADFSTLSDLSPMGDALKADGIASWNIEYRRLGQSGGGWPGTYQDIGHAIDHLRELAPKYHLDLNRVVIVGHSAGGHLALWSASRGKLPTSSPIAAPNPLKPRGVVNLAGLPDLRENVAGYEKLCSRPVIHEMLGGEPHDVADHARAAAASERLPLGVAQVLVLGDHEDFVPKPIAEAYVAKARTAGDSAHLILIPGAGHFEIAATTTPAWRQVRSAILVLLQMDRPQPAAPKAR